MKLTFSSYSNKNAQLLNVIINLISTALTFLSHVTAMILVNSLLNNLNVPHGNFIKVMIYAEKKDWHLFW